MTQSDDTVDYIARMVTELKGLAAGQELVFLAYLLSLVEAEAINRTKMPPPDTARLA